MFSNGFSEDNSDDMLVLVTVSIIVAIAASVAYTHYIRLTDCPKTITLLATWFYGHQEYGLVQLIWQDEKYCWPWEAGFCPAGAQPLVFQSDEVGRSR